MRLAATPLAGLGVIQADPFSDERGSFSRVWDASELRRLGLTGQIDQCNVSRNRRRATLRGMHWQAAPREETKLVSCVRGRVFDVAVDARPDSPTHLQWWGTELVAGDGTSLYIPPGFAHGFVTLEDRSDVLYCMTGDHSPEHARGFRYNDPNIGITWSITPEIVSPRDLSLPLTA